MDLREKVAEVLYQRPEYPSGMAEKLARDASQRRADAVMGVVEAEIGGAIGEAEAFKAYARELRMQVDARDARVRELEEENQRMRHELAVACGETVGNVPTWAEYAEAERARAAREAQDQPKPHMSLERAREMAAQAAAHPEES